jgi:hypothetical protein
MCGTDTSNKPRGGALAALSAPSIQQPSTDCLWNGELTFHTPGQPSSAVATHVRLTVGDHSSLDVLSEAVVLIQ